MFVPYLAPSFQTVPYTVIPVDCAGTGIDQMNKMTENISHEFVEAATDPTVPAATGWIGNQFFHPNDIVGYFKNAEASDQCEMFIPAHKTQTIDGSLSVSTYWSNRDKACVPEPPPEQLLCQLRQSQEPALPVPEPSPTDLGKSAFPPLFGQALAKLRPTSTYQVTATMNAKAGPGESAVSAHFTLTQNGRRAASLEGEAVVNGKVSRFGVLQVGRRRCFLGAKGWTCATGPFAPIDVASEVRFLFARQFSSQPSAATSGAGVLTVSHYIWRSRVVTRMEWEKRNKQDVVHKRGGDRVERETQPTRRTRGDSPYGRARKAGSCLSCGRRTARGQVVYFLLPGVLCKKCGSAHVAQDRLPRSRTDPWRIERLKTFKAWLLDERPKQARSEQHARTDQSPTTKTTSKTRAAPSTGHELVNRTTQQEARLKASKPAKPSARPSSARAKGTSRRGGGQNRKKKR